MSERRKNFRRSPYWEIATEVIEDLLGAVCLFGGIIAVWFIGCGLA